MFIGSGDISLPPPEHCHKVNCDHTHNVYISGGEVDIQGADVPAVVRTGDPGPGEDAVSRKGGGNSRDGGGGGQGRSGKLMQRVILQRLIY